ncbi:MAG TPA: asparagine synthase (glutamine-hydrolyzing), partial [Rhodospirillaceae bacterium]|nr:asparagine synthase (glutamine-hydrolyzing) [Rhodospirillaceae bacterium]
FESVVLAARRLRIHDLSPRADQPFYSDDESHVLIFNGAIFNYRALRTELQRLGHSFKTTSDTEVVLKALQEWDTGALERFDGMFAIAWLDRTRDRVILARDRFGIKPLYLYRDEQMTLFASEIKPILAHPNVPRRVDEAVVAEFFAFQMVTPPKTMYERIEQLKPGHFIAIDAAHGAPIEEHIFWQIDNRLLEQSDPPTVEAAMIEAVERCWDADRTVAVQLSGGVDSSLITAVSHDILDRKDIHSFSVIFDDASHKYAPPKSEESYIRHVTDRFVKSPHLSCFSPAQIATAFPEAIWHHEVPLCSANSVLLLMHAKDIREKTTVLLSGEGSDDIYLGYFDGLDFIEDPNSFSRFYISAENLRALFGSDGVEKAGARRKNLINEPRFEGMSLPQKASALTIETVLHGLLARHDRMFMSQSIEGRPPFCSEGMVKARFALPDDQVHANQCGKIAVRAYAENFYDNDFVYRTKQWMAGPVADWCASDSVWKGYIESVNTQTIGNYFDPTLFTKILDLPESTEKWSGANLALMFAVTNFALWHRIFIENADPLSEHAWHAEIPDTVDTSALSQQLH